MIESMFDLKTETIEIEGGTVRLLRDGGEGGIPLLLTAPWPESLYAFHRVWPTFQTLGPVIAVDLPGFGASEWRKEVMSPLDMGGFLIRLIDRLELERVHAIVPDVGTLAALFAAAEAPERFESIVGGSGGADMNLLGDQLRQIVVSTRADFAGIDGGQQVVDLIQSTAREPVPSAVLEDYRASSAGSRWNETADFVRAYATDLPVLGHLLPTIPTPVLVISGSDDPFVPPSNGDFLRENLPRCATEIVSSGHFVWEDASDEYARLVADWIGGRYTTV